MGHGNGIDKALVQPYNAGTGRLANRCFGNRYGRCLIAGTAQISIVTFISLVAGQAGVVRDPRAVDQRGASAHILHHLERVCQNQLRRRANSVSVTFGNLVQDPLEHPLLARPRGCCDIRYIRGTTDGGGGVYPRLIGLEL